jgi:hypothetical protein
MKFSSNKLLASRVGNTDDKKNVSSDPFVEPENPNFLSGPLFDPIIVRLRRYSVRMDASRSFDT